MEGIIRWVLLHARVLFGEGGAVEGIWGSRGYEGVVGGMGYETS